MIKKVLVTSLIAGAAMVTMFTSCKDDNDDDDTVAFTTATPYAAVGTVASQAINTTNGTVIISWDSLKVPLVPGGSIAFVSRVNPSPSTNVPSIQVTLGNINYSDNSFDDEAKFYDYFRKGAGQFTYGVDMTNSGTNRNVNITYTDANGNVWSSDRGTAAQPSSAFQISDTLHLNKTGGSVLKFKAAFNCKLYNDNGDAIDASITNFVGQVETYE